MILQLSALGAGARFRLSGPGLRAPTNFAADGLPSDFAARWAANRARFPLGVDLILCAGARLAALPRTVAVEEALRWPMSQSRAASGRSTAAHAWLAEARRGDPAVADLSLPQIENQLGRAVDRVMARGFAARPRTRRAGDQAGAGRSDRGGVPAACVPHHAAALRRGAADRHRGDGGAPARLGDLQGSARRPGAGADLRLHASAAGFRTRRCAAGRARRRARRGADAPRARHPRPRRADGGRRGFRRRAWRPDARAAGVSRRARRAPAGLGARRRGFPARARLLDPARLRRHASVRRRNPHGRGVGGDRTRRSWVSPSTSRDITRDRVPDGEPVQGLEDRAAAVHPRLRAGVRPFASARRWRWRWSIARCARPNWART